MSDTQEVLSHLARQDERLKSIEEAVVGLAVQNEKIVALQQQTSSLWGKYDEAFGPTGVVSKVMQFQASCAGRRAEKHVNYLWGAFLTLALATVMRYIRS